MIDLINSISNSVAAKFRKSIKPNLDERPLKIAVLGPGLDGNNFGSRKRHQILKSLREDGHDPFFPEDCVDSAIPFESVLTQECALLSEPDVDLVIILHTENSMGVLMEIGRFEEFPEIKAKTAILFPRRFYYDEGVPSNTVRNFLVVHPYTEEQYETCRVVGTCRFWASSYRSRLWPARQFYRP